jgi:hypothetical protein
VQYKGLISTQIGGWYILAGYYGEVVVVVVVVAVAAVAVVVVVVELQK